MSDDKNYAKVTHHTTDAAGTERLDQNLPDCEPFGYLDAYK